MVKSLISIFFLKKVVMLRTVKTLDPTTTASENEEITINPIADNQTSEKVITAGDVPTSAAQKENQVTMNTFFTFIFQRFNILSCIYLYLIFPLWLLFFIEVKNSICIFHWLLFFKNFLKLFLIYLLLSRK